MEKMMKQLNKKLVDEAIRTNKKYYRTHDSDFMYAVSNARDRAFGEDSHWIDEIITGITWKRRDHNEPYETYYKVLEVLGFEVVEE